MGAVATIRAQHLRWRLLMPLFWTLVHLVTGLLTIFAIIHEYTSHGLKCNDAIFAHLVQILVLVLVQDCLDEGHPLLHLLVSIRRDEHMQLVIDFFALLGLATVPAPDVYLATALLLQCLLCHPFWPDNQPNVVRVLQVRHGKVHFGRFLLCFVALRSNELLVHSLALLDDLAFFLLNLFLPPHRS